MPTRGSIIRPFVERFLITNGMAALPTQIETVSDSFGRAFVRAERRRSGSFRPASSPTSCRTALLVALPVDTSDTRGPVGLTMRTDFAPSPAFSILLQTIREAAAHKA